jgi:hypothetical protein
MKNLKWCIVDTRTEGPSVMQDMNICESREEAIEKAKILWFHLSDHDKKYYSVIAGTCNIEAGYYAINQYGEYDTTIYEIAWNSSHEVENKNVEA